MAEPWFAAKRYGLGLSPSSTAGWIATAVYVAAMAAVGFTTHALAAPKGVIPVVLGLLTLAFIGVAVLKSDRRPWRWRWGGR
jgi:hypothetical protein